MNMKVTWYRKKQHFGLFLAQSINYLPSMWRIIIKYSWLYECLKHNENTKYKFYHITRYTPYFPFNVVINFFFYFSFSWCGWISLNIKLKHQLLYTLNRRESQVNKNVGKQKKKNINVEGSTPLITQGLLSQHLLVCFYFY